MRTRVGYSHGIHDFFYKSDIPAYIKSKIEQDRQIWVGKIGYRRHRYDDQKTVYGYCGMTEEEYLQWSADIYTPLAVYLILAKLKDDPMAYLSLDVMVPLTDDDINEMYQIIMALKTEHRKQYRYYWDNCVDMQFQQRMRLQSIYKSLGYYINKMVKTYNDYINEQDKRSEA